jgi:hypothetical protein
MSLKVIYSFFIKTINFINKKDAAFSQFFFQTIKSGLELEANCLKFKISNWFMTKYIRNFIIIWIILFMWFNKL